MFFCRNCNAQHQGPSNYCAVCGKGPVVESYIPTSGGKDSKAGCIAVTIVLIGIPIIVFILVFIFSWLKG